MSCEYVREWLEARRNKAGLRAILPFTPTRRVSLRFLLVLFVVLGVAFAYASVRFREWQARAPHRLAQELGPHIYYTEHPTREFCWGGDDSGGERTPIWVLHNAEQADVERFNAFAKKYPGYIQSVAISTRTIFVSQPPQFMDEGLREIGRVPHLHSLRLPQPNAHLSDDAWESLGGHTELRQLEATQLHCTPRVAAVIGKFTQLEVLLLKRATIDDEAWPHLERLTRLRRLDLWMTNVTDAHLAHVAKLRGLEELNLYSTKVTSQGVAQLAGLKQMRVLDLCNTQVDDDVLATLREMPRLEQLELSVTRISNAGIDSLERENLRLFRSYNGPRK